MTDHSSPVNAVLDREERYLLEHFDADCGIMPGDVEGSFHRIREAFSIHAQRTRPRAFLDWAVDMFGPVAKLRSERLLRFVEEAIELAHAEGMERAVFNKVADRVYSRPAGDTPKEIGQAQACLETFAENIGLSSDGEAQREWERVQGIPRDEWSRRHTAKQALGIALTSPDRRGELAEWKQAARVEAGLRREFLERAEKAEAELAAIRPQRMPDDPGDDKAVTPCKNCGGGGWLETVRCRRCKGRGFHPVSAP